MTSRSSLLGAEARRVLTAAVVAIESRTAAEIVVTVVPRSSPYRHADHIVGATLALLALAGYFYLPIVFTDDLTLPITVLCYGLGLFAGPRLRWLTRLLLRRREMREQVRQAAEARFVSQRVSATRGRTGVLVYVSLLERHLEVVPDLGIDVAAMGPSWATALADLQDCAHRRRPLADMDAALRRLGDALAAALPRADDDINELPDGVQA